MGLGLVLPGVGLTVRWPMSQMVESRMGAVAWGLWPTLRFPSPLIEPDVPISGIRLSDWLHREVHGEQTNRTRLRCGE